MWILSICAALALNLTLFTTHYVLDLSEAESPLSLCYDSEPNSTASRGKLLEKRQVVFAKVHKAASSTVQNILLRFAMARNLSTLLPFRGVHINHEGPWISRANVIPSVEGRSHYDILCSHVMYQREEIGHFFSQSAFRVAIIREPMKQALSALAYYTLVYPRKELTDGAEKHKEDPVGGFFRHPEDFSNGFKCLEPRTSISNRMSFDLGLDVDHIIAAKQNKTLVKMFLNKVEKEFGLVLVSDYFDESMVLLKRYLRWSMKDILYFRVNEMNLDKNSVWRKKPNVSITSLLEFRNCNQIDYELYEHFLPIFLAKVGKERLFKEEVSAYKDILKTVESFCLDNDERESLLVPKNDWTSEFIVSRCECDLMRLSEIKLVDIARKKQLRLHKEYIPRRSSWG